VKRSLDQDLFEEVLAYMQETTFLERASERMWKCEGLVAEAKQNCIVNFRHVNVVRSQVAQLDSERYFFFRPKGRAFGINTQR
jgi:hypothetical protein